MTADKAQLRFSSDEDGEEEEDGGEETEGGGRTLDDILIRDQSVHMKPLSSKSKSKKLHIDQRAFKDIEAKIARQNAADAFRRRFAPTKVKPPPPAVDDDVQDIDEFLGELKLVDGKSSEYTTQLIIVNYLIVSCCCSLLARTPLLKRLTDAAKISTAQPYGMAPAPGVEVEVDDDGWLDEMLASGGKARGT